MEEFETEKIYHIYTHSVGSELLFRENDNFNFFLRQISKYILPVADILCYCLMKNHFHLLVKFKNLEELKKQFESKEFIAIDEHRALMKPFSNLLNSYAKAYNKKYGRKGALFYDFVKRKCIEDEQYFLKSVHYIHNNPVNRGFVENIEDWKYSSYQSYLKPEKFSSVERSFVMSFFDDVNSFESYHKSVVEYPFLD